MSLKLGNTDINGLGNGINKAYLGVDIVFTSAVVEYLRNLTNTNRDYLSILDSEVNMDVPLTGVFEYGGVFTIPVTPVFCGLMGRTLSGFDLGRYGFWGNAIENVLRVQANDSTDLDIPNFFTNYGGQKIEIKIRYEGLDCIAFINGVEVGRVTITGRPSTNTKTFFIGVYGSATGLEPNLSSFLDGKVHSFFHGDKVWNCNEDSGFPCYSEGIGYEALGSTSNAGQLTYWEANVIKPDI